jgi:hypothetical protein
MLECVLPNSQKQVVQCSGAGPGRTTAWCPGGLQMPKPDVLLLLPGGPAADASMTASTSDMAAPDACHKHPGHPSACFGALEQVTWRQTCRVSQGFEGTWPCLDGIIKGAGSDVSVSINKRGCPAEHDLRQVAT